MKPRTFVHDIVIDHNEGQVYVDGVRLPWWLEIPGPEVEQVDDLPIHVVRIPLLVEGTVTILGDGGIKRYDPVLGDVGKWAAEYVRSELSKLYPGLDL